MSKKRRYIVSIILVGLVAAAIGLLTNVVSVGIVIPLWLAGSLLIVVIGFGIGLAAWQFLFQADYETVVARQQDRQRMLAKVHAFWIKGVLEKSLHDVVRIELGLHEKPDAIANPWHLVLQQQDQSEQPLHPGTRITEVYDNALGELLILGEPGSGKTTLLLELARDLLRRAEVDENLPIPVVFNLSSWAVKRQSLVDWLVGEMNTKYQVPRKLGQSWVDGDHVLPLLDGLDEVASMHRTACVDAINTYRREHGLVSTVVCSRSADYLDLRERILLRTAVVVQPLTTKQIDDYLSAAGGQLESVREALSDDTVLQELATTPLMLSVLSLAYHGMSVNELLAEGSSETRRQQVFTMYVQRMLQRRGIVTHYTTQQTMHWLMWLAKQMAQHGQTEFYIERMQPDWLPDTQLRFVYSVIETPIRIMTFRSSKKEIEPAEIVSWSWQKARRALAVGLGLWLVFALILVLVGELIGLLSSKPFIGLGVGLILGTGVTFVLGTMMGGGLSSKRMDKHNIFAPNQGIWRSARNGLLIGLLNSLISGLGVGLIFGLASGLVFGLIFGLSIWLIVGLTSGLLFGGDAFIQHFYLRFLLWRAGYMPLNYPQFLDYAAERILLRKVGGGYIFVHILLLEYFASLDTTL